MAMIENGLISDIYENSHILLVDDDQVNLLILQEFLALEGYKNIMTAISAKAALDIIEKLPVDIILLDVMMPVKDGVSFCYELRNNPDTAHLPIIIQTAQKEMLTKAFEAGATDFICKPIDRKELTVRTKILLHNARFVNDLSVYRRRMTNELREAQAMQHMLLPSPSYLKALSTSSQFNLLSHHHALLKIGGDFWGCWQLDERKLAVYMVDISGHGISAALNAFRLHTLIEDGKQAHGLDPSEFLSYLNTRLCSFMRDGQFATMFYGIIDIKSEQIKYAVAATTQAIVIRKQEKKIDFLEQKGYPLGILKEATYKLHKAPFSTGDGLLLYSDALIETPNNNGQYFENQMIESYILSENSLPHENSKEFFNQFVSHYYSQYAKRLNDDLSIVYCSTSAN